MDINYNKRSMPEFSGVEKKKERGLSSWRSAIGNMFCVSSLMLGRRMVESASGNWSSSYATAWTIRMLMWQSWPLESLI